MGIESMVFIDGSAARSYHSLVPTVLRSGPYRFFFYSGDRDEPPHVHVERDDNKAKFWLDPVRLDTSGGFSRKEISDILHQVIDHQSELLRSWMSSSAYEIRSARAQDVTVTDDTLSVDLSDGRTISVPLSWYPRLLHGSREERGRWRLIGRGEGIHWPELDEDISVENLILGRASGESQQSFKKWATDLASHRD